MRSAVPVSINIAALGWFAWHGGGYRQGLPESKCSVLFNSKVVKMLQNTVLEWLCLLGS